MEAMITWVLLHGAGLTSGCLGVRDSFCDVGQSIASWLGLPSMDQGVNLVDQVALAGAAAAGATA